jgi:hypothetical protein
MAAKKKPASTAESKPAETDAKTTPRKPALKRQPAGEVGGPKGPEPTRYGDWQQKGRTTDF